MTECKDKYGRRQRKPKSRMDGLADVFSGIDGIVNSGGHTGHGGHAGGDGGGFCGGGDGGGGAATS